jgi:hypothetical protein
MAGTSEKPIYLLGIEPMYLGLAVSVLILVPGMWRKYGT